MSSAPEPEPKSGARLGVDGDGAGQAEVGSTEGQFSVQRIYVKDVSFESPNAPAVFTVEWKPNVNLNLQTNATQIAEELYEVVITVTATLTVGDKTAFLAEVQQAGIFGIRGVDEKTLGPLLGSYCPNVLFPYAREAISDLVTRGGFPQFLLAPVNFDALYQQHLQDQGTQGPVV